MTSPKRGSEAHALEWAFKEGKKRGEKSDYKRPDKWDKRTIGSEYFALVVCARHTEPWQEPKDFVREFCRGWAEGFAAKGARS